MTDTPNQDAAVQSIQEILRQEYLRGFQDGARQLVALEIKVAAMFAEALKGALPAREIAVTPEKKPINHLTTKKAPKGAVGAAVSEILRAYPGSSITAIEEVCAVEAPEVASRSIGNELRRLEGKKYRREGRNWFLISEPETETAEGALESASAA